MTTKENICPECKGGKMVDHILMKFMNGSPVSVPCPTCKGSGLDPNRPITEEEWVWLNDIGVEYDRREGAFYIGIFKVPNNSQLRQLIELTKSFES